MKRAFTLIELSAAAELGDGYGGTNPSGTIADMIAKDRVAL